MVGYLSLDAAEASEPEDLAVAELPLCVVDLVHVLQLLQLLVRDLLLLRAVACRLEEFEAAGGDGGDHLRDGGGRGLSVTTLTSNRTAATVARRKSFKLASMTEETASDVIDS